MMFLSQKATHLLASGCNMMYPDGMSTMSMAMPDVGLSSVSVQAKQVWMSISDLFRPWKSSLTVRLKQSLDGWS